MKPFLSLLTTASLLLADGYTVVPKKCPKGMVTVVTDIGELKMDFKTGKSTFIPHKGRPSQKCVKRTKKKEKPEETGPYAIQIFQYGSASGMGQTYPSKKECETQRAHLAEANRGLDYTYTCIKQSK